MALLPEDQKQIDDITKRLTSLEDDKSFDFHHHTGTDSNQVNYIDLDNKKIWKTYTLFGASPATVANYSTFFIVPLPSFITSFKEVHETAGSDAGVVSLNIEKLTGTTAPGAGTVLATALSLKTTANTVQTATLVTSIATINCAANDRLALKLVGTPTDVAGLTVLIELTIV